MTHASYEHTWARGVLLAVVAHIHRRVLQIYVALFTLSFAITRRKILPRNVSRIGTYDRKQSIINAIGMRETAVVNLADRDDRPHDIITRKKKTENINMQTEQPYGRCRMSTNLKNKKHNTTTTQHDGLTLARSHSQTFWALSEVCLHNSTIHR